VTDAGVTLLTTEFHQSLTALHLAYCRAVTDAGLGAVTRLGRLVTLDVYQVPMVTPQLVAELVR